MIKLNLTTSCEEHEILKKYLEETVSETLADKINNGVRVEKDGKSLISKKDLDGFMNYAQGEARKIAEKGKNYKAVYHDTVFAWAIHYFEEDSIEGTLYNEDGTKYAAPIQKSAKAQPTPVKTVQKPKQAQFSLFDLMDEKKPVETQNDNDLDDEEPSEEDIQEALEIIHKEDEKPKGSSVYQKYMEIQKQYPDYIVAIRLGDFYEVFGENAVKISNELELTLTGRDCGLPERIPMVGFPYHAADNYFDKITQFATVVVAELNNVKIKNQIVKYKNVDYDTGEIYDDLTEEEMREFDGDYYEPNIKDIDDDNNDDEIFETAKSLDKDIMLKLYSLLDEKMTVQ